MNETILIPAADMKETLLSVLLRLDVEKEKAETLAQVFTSNSVDGVYTHGVNRFPVFVQYMKDGYVKKEADPTLTSAFYGMERWNGNLGPGPLNAIAATNRAVELAGQYGIGCVALANTNHWMRGGYYGWEATKKGAVMIAWTNTTNLMPAWGAVDAKLGNNPLVMALPYGEEAIVLDMAMSQYSFGAMELTAARREKLSVTGGYDEEGKLTDDPSSIIASRRPLPVGYWKGAGLSLLLDILATVLSGGLSTHRIAAQQKEHGLSQVFVCIDQKKLGNPSLIGEAVSSIIADYHQSKTTGGTVRYPGEKVLQTRAENLQNGVPVLGSVWADILQLNA